MESRRSQGLWDECLPSLKGEKWVFRHLFQSPVRRENPDKDARMNRSLRDIVSDDFLPLKCMLCVSSRTPSEEHRVNCRRVLVYTKRRVTFASCLSILFLLFFVHSLCCPGLPVGSPSPSLRRRVVRDTWHDRFLPFSTFSTRLPSRRPPPRVDPSSLSSSSSATASSGCFVSAAPRCFSDFSVKNPGEASCRRCAHDQVLGQADETQDVSPFLSRPPSSPRHARLSWPAPVPPKPLCRLHGRHSVLQKKNSSFFDRRRHTAFLSPSSSTFLRGASVGRPGLRQRRGALESGVYRHPSVGQERRPGDVRRSPLSTPAFTSLFARALYPGLEESEEIDEGEEEKLAAWRGEDEAWEAGTAAPEAESLKEEARKKTQTTRSTQESALLSSAAEITLKLRERQRKPLPFHRYLSARLNACRCTDQVLRLVSRHRARMDDVHRAIALQTLARIVSSREEEERESQQLRWRRRRESFANRRSKKAGVEEAEHETDSTGTWTQLVTNEVFLRLLQDVALCSQLRGFSRTVDLAFVPWALAKLRLYLLPSLQPLLSQILRAVDVHTDAPASPVSKGNSPISSSLRQGSQDASSPLSSSAALLSSPRSSGEETGGCTTGGEPFPRLEESARESNGERRRSKQSCSLAALKPAGLATLVWGTSKCRYRNPVFWEEKLAPLLRDRASLFSPKELAICLYACANVGVRARVISRRSPSQSVETQRAAALSDVDSSDASASLFRFSGRWGEEREQDAAAKREERGAPFHRDESTLNDLRAHERFGCVDCRVGSLRFYATPTRAGETGRTGEVNREGAVDREGEADREGGREGGREKNPEGDRKAERENEAESEMDVKGKKSSEAERNSVNEAIEALGRACIDKLSDMNGQSLSSVAWAFAKWRLDHPPLFERLASEVRRRGHSFDVQTATLLLYAFLRLEYTDETVLSILADRLTKKLGSFRRENFSLCAWAAAKAPRNSAVRRLGDVLFPALEQESLEAYRRQDLILLLWSAACIQGSRSADLAKRIFGELRKNKETKTFRAVDVAMLLHASSITGVTDVEMLENHLRLIPTLLARGACSLAELNWITASLAHLGAGDETFLSEVASHLEKRKSWDAAALEHLTSFLFFSVHLAPNLHRKSPAVRRLLDLVRTFLVSPPSNTGSSVSAPASFSSGFSPSSSSPSLPSPSLADSFSSSSSSPSFPSPASGSQPVFQLAAQQRIAALVGASSVAAPALAVSPLASASASTPAAHVRLLVPPLVSVKPGAFANGVAALVRSGLVNGRDGDFVATFLRFVEARAEDIDCIDWAKLHDSGERLGLGRKEQWRRLLAELPRRLQRRYMLIEASESNGEEMCFYPATTSAPAADEEPFEIADEETIERHAQEHGDEYDGGGWGDIEVDLGEPKPARQHSDGIPAGVDPADVITDDELYALLSSKLSRDRAGKAADKRAFDYRKQDSLYGTQQSK
ncbi:UNVERIFIED_CONTAM: hypothetical protein HHA_246978 [Hammondia hammondi]|eukprot:XP_008883748.1 hypothetical protein HHA_246978 [Hammondia hammondi]